jgi:beta-aspartyl-peptidase (threonine type)
MPEEALEHLAEQPDLWRWTEIVTDPQRDMGTVNFIAQDAQGNICAGASTSGLAWKYPGRLGDTPVIGAGVYADSRYGAAACTGMGEMAIRASTARSVVFYLRMGMSLEEAGRQAMADLNDLGGRYLSGMNFIALDRDGGYAGFSSAEDGTYVYMTGDMDGPEEMPRTYVPTKERWGREA